MLTTKELQWASVALNEVDTLLRSMADYRQYPDLINRSDARLQTLLEHIVTSVRDARLLNSKVLTRVDQAHATLLERAQSAGQEASAGGSASTTEMAAPPVRTFQPPANMEQITMANPTGMRELVLVADHDTASLASIETMLTDEDYRVVSVRDAFEAISVYARLWAAIDLVILDFSMPGMSGDLIFDELQAINPKVAVVVSSGFTHPDKLSQMLGQGLSGFLPKPFEKAKFIRQIAQVIAHRPSQSAAQKL